MRGPVGDRRRSGALDRDVAGSRRGPRCVGHRGARGGPRDRGGIGDGRVPLAGAHRALRQRPGNLARMSGPAVRCTVGSSARRHQGRGATRRPPSPASALDRGGVGRVRRPRGVGQSAPRGLTWGGCGARIRACAGTHPAHVTTTSNTTRAPVPHGAGSTAVAHPRTDARRGQGTHGHRAEHGGVEAGPMKAAGGTGMGTATPGRAAGRGPYSSLQSGWWCRRAGRITALHVTFLHGCT